MAGVDEVGMGCLAGPVVSAAVIMPLRARRISGVRDSKLLTGEEREELAPRIRRQALNWGVGAASVPEIERLNILHASRLAMCRALSRLGGHDHALIDGRRILGLPLGPHTAIVDGDASCYAIACASILAKVTRDTLMRRLALRYPGYGWETNVGYSTPVHKRALAQLGASRVHRRGYNPVRAVLPADDVDELDVALPQAGLALPAGTLHGQPARFMAAGVTRVEGTQLQLLAVPVVADEAGTPLGQLPDGAWQTLQQITVTSGAKDIHVRIDGWHGCVAPLAAVLRGCSTKVSAGSGNIQQLAALRRLAPGVALAVRFAPDARLAGMLVAGRFTGAQLAELPLELAALPLIAALHAAGLQVISPPAANDLEALCCQSLGLDVIVLGPRDRTLQPATRGMECGSDGIRQRASLA
ncbi:MAG: ribonuclease HII [Chloroflexota bacterium]